MSGRVYDPTLLDAAHKREYQADKVAKDCVDRFMGGELGGTAEAEGWGMDLWRFAYQSARLQAAFMFGTVNPGFDAWIVTGGTLAGDQTTQALRQFVSYCRSQAQTGRIEIEVPQRMIDGWRLAAHYRAAMANSPERSLPKLSNPPPLFTPGQLFGLDREIESQAAQRRGRA